MTANAEHARTGDPRWLAGRRVLPVGVSVLRVVLLVGFVAAVYGVVVYLVDALWPDEPGALRVLLLLCAATISVAGLNVVDPAVRAGLGRLFRVSRATPYATLTALSGQLAGATTVDAAMAELARMLAEGTGAASASVWLLVADRLVPAASWPAPLEPVATTLAELTARPDVDHVAEVRHADGVLGALAIAKPAGDFLTPVDVRLVNDVGNSASLLIRNARLTARLAERVREMTAQETERNASRRRLIRARDITRQRLVDDINSTVRHNLRQINTQLPELRDAVTGDREQAGALLARLQGQASQLVEYFRSIVHGVYPPVLRDHGLPAALRALAATLPRRIEVSTDGVGRHSPDIEGTLYFVASTLARLRVVGVADAPLRLRCWRDADALHLSFTDQLATDLPTLPAEALADVGDRLAALGGTLLISHDQEFVLHALVPIPPAPDEVP